MTDTEPVLGAMQIGKRASGTVSIVMEFDVDEVLMPVDGDFGKQAQHELWLKDRMGDYDEYDILHAEIDEEEPVYEDELDEEDWPEYV